MPEGIFNVVVHWCFFFLSFLPFLWYFFLSFDWEAGGWRNAGVWRSKRNAEIEETPCVCAVCIVYFQFYDIVGEIHSSIENVTIFFFMCSFFSWGETLKKKKRICLKLIKFQGIRSKYFSMKSWKYVKGSFWIIYSECLQEFNLFRWNWIFPPVFSVAFRQLEKLVLQARNYLMQQWDIVKIPTARW